MTSRPIHTLAATVVAFAVAGTAAAQGGNTSGAEAPAGTGEGMITARLTTADGTDIGYVLFRDMRAGVHVEADLTDLPPGPHGFHIHETGACTPDFSAAGEHLAPEGHEHGFAANEEPHPGDLPNIWVADDGTVRAEFINWRLTMDQLLDEDGSAVMVHSAADTYMDPASAGERIACGVVEQRS
jgi:superoxide dismutase, Cu-Zn family